MALNLKHVVLGLVAEQPGHGYELMRRAEQRFGWGGTAVYQALDALEAEGYVLSDQTKDAASPRAAPRTVYSATGSGLQFLHDWLLEPSRFAWPRQELDIRLSLSSPAEWPKLIDEIAGQEQWCLAELRRLNGEAAIRRPPSPRVTWSEAGAMLQRNAQIKMLQARVEYLQEARALLRELRERTPRLVNSNTR
jgi:DNA-binding PadR family transcriptional regulator